LLPNCQYVTIYALDGTYGVVMATKKRNQLVARFIDEGIKIRGHLSAEELISLKELAKGLLKKRIPQSHRDILTKKGLAKATLGRLQITMRGRFAIR